MGRVTNFICDACGKEEAGIVIEQENGPLVLPPEKWLHLRLRERKANGHGEVCSRDCAANLAKSLKLDI